ncbi:MAG: HD-GYP domain-containing protein [Blastocatellales bacterium]
MQPQQAPFIFAEAERPLGERLLKLALETDRVEGYTEPHAVMIARLAETIGKQLGLHGQDLSALKFAALAHDVGERGMKRNYLLAPSPLSWEQTLDLWRHPILGEQAAADLRLPRQTQLLVRWHHEWWNGQGYPDGIAGTAIPIGARILRAVDSYCALISRRPYREAFSLIEAEQKIADLAGIEFDPLVVRLLLAVVIEERKQREADTWNVQPEPDLQYVSPGEESLVAAGEVISQTDYVEIEEDVFSGENILEKHSDPTTPQISESITVISELAMETNPHTETSSEPTSAISIDDSAESSPVEDFRRSEAANQAELQQATTSELIPQEQSDKQAIAASAVEDQDQRTESEI